MAQDLPKVPDDKVQEALESASKHYQGRHQALRGQAPADITHDDGHLSTRAACITITVSNGQVCLNLPLGIGNACLPVPVSYDGQVASACLDMCTTWGVPTGVKVTVSVAGIQIVQKTFGKC
jgi:hypothetical protein